MILMRRAHCEQIHNHAFETYPEECCGLLLGKINNNEKQVIEVRSTPNSWNLHNEENLPHILSFNTKKLSKENRFSIAPKVILKIQKEARNLELQIIGVYHSHPNYPAIPSEFDRAIAWPEYSYIIVSLQPSKTTDLKSWYLDDKGQFQAEEFQIT
ncbi:MAG TPA: hypothetical protein DCF68_13275 [Cyanothece sp. UBA12306]|nr:hypothetical protein [Cyanothece sp. UBA12306]